MANKLYLKTVLKDTAESWKQNKSIMPNGIVAYEEDTNKIKICDGKHKFEELPYVVGDVGEAVLFNYKGSVNTIKELPTDASKGDVYNVKSNGANYLFDGSEWDKMSETINLEPYETKEDASKTYATKSEVSSTYETKEEVARVNEENAKTFETKAKVQEINTTLEASIATKADKETLEAEIKSLKDEIKNLKSSIPSEPITSSEMYSLLRKSGKIQLVQDVVVDRSIATGIIANNQTTINLNGNTLTIQPTTGSTGCLMAGGKSHYTFVGNGSVTEDGNLALLSAVGENAIIDIYGGTYESKGNECLYSYEGTINVYGGTFKTTSETKTFLLNCKDEKYKEGIAKINVYGGKFYDFDPSNSSSENPVANFVADGYTVQSYADGEHTVYEVVKA